MKESASPGSPVIRSRIPDHAQDVAMHADHVCVQACQPATGHDTGLMFRTCEDRKDYHGGPNQFASLDLLNRPEDLARRIRAVCRI